MLNVTTPSLAMQLCGPNYDSTHIFGVAVTSNATFAPIQDAIQGWANATCLTFLGSTMFPGKATFATPLLGGNLTNSIVGTWNSTHARSHVRHARSHGTHSKVSDKGDKFLQARADCRTVQVASGDGCGELAVKCGIANTDFTKYNPNICGTLKPKQHLCCSSGSLPDVRPQPNTDGSCFAYNVKNDDNCANLGAEYGLTNEEIEGFNENTWGWSGCKLRYSETIMCLPLIPAVSPYSCRFCYWRLPPGQFPPAPHRTAVTRIFPAGAATRKRLPQES